MSFVAAEDDSEWSVCLITTFGVLYIGAVAKCGWWIIKRRVEEVASITEGFTHPKHGLCTNTGACCTKRITFRLQLP
jgi:hypothetical protein